MEPFSFRMMSCLLPSETSILVCLFLLCERCDIHTYTHTGMIVIPTIIPRLPFGSNHLAISEETTIALLCLVMELFIESVENAR